MSHLRLVTMLRTGDEGYLRTGPCSGKERQDSETARTTMLRQCLEIECHVRCSGISCVTKPPMPTRNTRNGSLVFINIQSLLYIIYFRQVDGIIVNSGETPASPHYYLNPVREITWHLTCLTFIILTFMALQTASVRSEELGEYRFTAPPPPPPHF